MKLFIWRIEGQQSVIVFAPDLQTAFYEAVATRDYLVDQIALQPPVVIDGENFVIVGDYVYTDHLEEAK